MSPDYGLGGSVVRKRVDTKERGRGSVPRPRFFSPIKTQSMLESIEGVS